MDGRTSSHSATPLLMDIHLQITALCKGSIACHACSFRLDYIARSAFSSFPLSLRYVIKSGDARC